MPSNIGSALNSLNQTLSYFAERKANLQGAVWHLQEETKKLEAEIADTKYCLEVGVLAVELLDFVQQAVRQTMQKSFEEVITLALQHIFGEGYRFEIAFDRRGNLSVADFNIKSPNLSIPADPLDSSGGGVIDVVGFALRVALLELHVPKIEGPIILDESFKHLSSMHLYNCANFLGQVSAKINRQIILVSHRDEFVELANSKIKVEAK